MVGKPQKREVADKEGVWVSQLHGIKHILTSQLEMEFIFYDIIVRNEVLLELNSSNDVWEKNVFVCLFFVFVNWPKNLITMTT